MKVNLDCNDLIMRLLIAFTLLVASTTLHAYIGQSAENFKRDLGRGIFDEGKSGQFVSKMSWQGNPRDCKANHLKALGDPLWRIEVTAFVELGKRGQAIHEICYHKITKGPINPAELQQIEFNNKSAGLVLKIIAPNKISITSKQFPALLAEKNQQVQQFKENYLCLGQTIQQLETRFGKGKQVNNANQAVKEWHFEKFDPAPNIKENWKIEVVLWKNLNDIEPVVHRVYYKRKTGFYPQELEWQRSINAGEKRWEENGVDAHFTKFKTTDGDLLAGIKKQSEPTCRPQEAVIYTQAYESALPFRASIGENFNMLKQRVKNWHDKRFTSKTLPDNSTENFLFLEKYFVKNLKNPQKPSEHWDIEVLVWRDDNKVHEVSYTKAGKHLSPDEIRQIKNMNNREPIKEPILIEPNSIRPEKITITSKQLAPLLAEKKRQLQQFKENYLCIGQTIQQLETRFGKGKQANNADQAVKEWHFEKFDPAPNIKQNWEIEVVLWKNLNDLEPVVHQVYYKRKAPFSLQELEWQRYINAGEKKWKKNGVDANFTKFKTDPEGLLAGVRKLQQEAVIYTKAFESALPFRACIGEDFDVLKLRVKNRHDKRFTAKTLPDNSTENFLFLEKYFVKNLKNPQKPSEHWDIEVLVWRDDNKVHEVSYTKVGKHLSPDEIQQIKNMNNREPIKQQILIEPNNIRPEKITITSKYLLALLAEKKQQFQQFKESYLCLGQTIQQLEKRFGKGKQVNNADQAVKEWHFEKFDPAPNIKQNWEIEVVLWKNLNDLEPVVHQVYYKRKAPFSLQELEWQRYINAAGKNWQEGGFNPNFAKFKTTDEELLAGVRVLQQEAVIYTQAFYKR